MWPGRLLSTNRIRFPIVLDGASSQRLHSFRRGNGFLKGRQSDAMRTAGFLFWCKSQLRHGRRIGKCMLFPMLWRTHLKHSHSGRAKTTLVVVAA